MPVISKITGAPFRFWCQKILPAVYDDSLSYYELLCKVVDYLNKVMEDDINVVNLVNELEEFVNNYFDNLDVQQEINNKLDAMAEDGSLSDAVEPYLDEIIGEYESQLDDDLAEYKETMDADVADFKSDVNDAIAIQDADILNFKNTVNTQVTAQNTEISTFKSNINTTVGQQNSDISVMQSQMSNFISTHSDIQTFTTLYESTELNGGHYEGQNITLSDPYTDYTELDIYWSYLGDVRVTRVASADVLANGVVISWFADSTADPPTSPAPLNIPLMSLTNGNSAHTQLTISTAYSETWTGLSTDDAVRNSATTNADYDAGSIIKIVGVEYQASAELNDIRVGANGVLYPSAGDAVRLQFDDVDIQIGEISENQSKNKLPISAKNSTVLGVNCVYVDGNLSRSGTSTGGGGRLVPLTHSFTIPAGTYTFFIETTGATVFIEKTSDDSIIATAVNNVPTTFTLTEDTVVYLGMTVADNTTYNDNYNIQLEEGTEKTQYQKPSYKTAYDKVARNNDTNLSKRLDTVETILKYSVNLLPVESKDSTVNNVVCAYSDGIITRAGTANHDGGRLTPLTDYFTLKAGTYTFWLNPTGATMVIEKKSDNSIVATAVNDVPATFTIVDDTEVYIGMTIANGITYNDRYEIQIEKGSNKTSFENPSYIAVNDTVAQTAYEMDMNNAFSSFMKFGVIGDSLSVGYIGDGVTERNPEYSWGRILSRRIGNICQLFAKAGTTTKDWFTDPYCYTEFIKPQNMCQAYVVAIGTNDVINSSFPVGTTADIDLSDSTNNADSFCGWYGKIIQSIIAYSNTAKIFLLTIPYPRVDTAKNNAIRSISALFPSNVFLVDLAEDYNSLFKEKEIVNFAYNGHFSIGGYSNISTIMNYAVSVTMKNNASSFVDIPHIPYGNASDVE